MSVLREARAIVVRPSTDFVWSEWADVHEALAEIDGYILQVQSGREVDAFRMKVLFAPTGCLQELCLSNGWGQEFLDLASRFDAATE